MESPSRSAAAPPKPPGPAALAAALLVAANALPLLGVLLWGWSLFEIVALHWFENVVLHLALLGGAFAISALGSPQLLLLILVVGKTAIDLALHRRSTAARDFLDPGGPSRPSSLP
jgi:hypothetical protein